MKYKIILQIKKILRMPIYRVDILRAAKAYRGFGLCYAIDETMYATGFRINIDRKTITKLFPLFGDKVYIFRGEILKAYWWKPGDWKSGRMDYLNWLIKKYKDDKTDLREIVYETRR